MSNVMFPLKLRIAQPHECAASASPGASSIVREIGSGRPLLKNHNVSLYAEFASAARCAIRRGGNTPVSPPQRLVVTYSRTC